MKTSRKARGRIERRHKRSAEDPALYAAVLTAILPREREKIGLTLEHSLFRQTCLSRYRDRLRRGGRPSKDGDRDRVRVLKSEGKSWREIKIQMDAETGKPRSEDAYRYLLRPYRPK